VRGTGSEVAVMPRPGRRGVVGGREDMGRESKRYGKEKNSDVVVVVVADVL